MCARCRPEQLQLERYRAPPAPGIREFQSTKRRPTHHRQCSTTRPSKCRFRAVSEMLVRAPYLVIGVGAVSKAGGVAGVRMPGRCFSSESRALSPDAKDGRVNSRYVGRWCAFVAAWRRRAKRRHNPVVRDTSRGLPPSISTTTSSPTVTIWPRSSSDLRSVEGGFQLGDDFGG